MEMEILLLDSLGVEPKRRIQEQGDSLDSRLTPKETLSGLKIYAMWPRCVKGGNRSHTVLAAKQGL